MIKELSVYRQMIYKKRVDVRIFSDLIECIIENMSLEVLPVFRNIRHEVTFSIFCGLRNGIKEQINVDSVIRSLG